MASQIILVGSDRYPPGLTPLHAAVNDATHLGGFFADGLGYGTRNVHVLANPSHREVVDKLLDAADLLSEGDLFLFYFAGHGKELVDRKRQYLLLPEVTPRLLTEDEIDGAPGVITVDSLIQRTNRMAGVRRIFIFDACRTELEAGHRSAGEALFGDPATIRATLARNACEPRDFRLATGAVPTGQAALAVEPPIVISVCKPLQRAFELVGPDLPNRSLGSLAIQKALQRGKDRRLPVAADARFMADVREMVADLVRDAKAKGVPVTGGQEPTIENPSEEVFFYRPDPTERLRLKDAWEQRFHLCMGQEAFDQPADDCARHALAQLRSLGLLDAAQLGELEDRLHDGPLMANAYGYRTSAAWEELARILRSPENKKQARDNAREIRDKADTHFRALGRSPSVEDCDIFEDMFPRSSYAPRVAELRDAALDRLAWAAACEAADAAAYQHYLDQHPKGQFRGHAASRLAAIQRGEDEAAWKQAREADTVAAYQHYQARVPQGLHHAEAAQRIQAIARRADDAAWALACAADTVAAYGHYLAEFEGRGVHLHEAEARVQAIERAARDAAEAAGRAFDALGLHPGSAACQRFVGEHSAHSPPDRLSEVQRRMVQAQAAETAFAALGSNPGIEACEAFLAGHRHAELVPQVERLLEQARLRADDSAWQIAQAAHSIKAIERYLAVWPAGLHREAAQSKLQALQATARWAELESSSDEAAIRAFVQEHGGSAEMPKAQRRLACLAHWRSAEKEDTAAAYRQHLERWADSPCRALAQQRLDQRLADETLRADAAKAFAALQTLKPTDRKALRAAIAEGQAYLQRYQALPERHAAVQSLCQQWAQALPRPRPWRWALPAAGAVALGAVLLINSTETEPTTAAGGTAEGTPGPTPAPDPAPRPAPKPIPAPPPAPDLAQTTAAYLKQRATLVQAAWWKDGKGAPPAEAAAVLAEANRLAQAQVPVALRDAMQAKALGLQTPRDAAAATRYAAQWLALLPRLDPTEAANRPEVIQTLVEITGGGFDLSQSGTAADWQAALELLRQVPNKTAPSDYWQGVILQCALKRADDPAVRQAYERTIAAAAMKPAGDYRFADLYDDMAYNQLNSAKPCSERR